MSEPYDRRTTPVVDRVEVVALSYGKRRGLVFPCTLAQGEEIVGLWRKLPEAEQARCHVPVYGLQFYVGQALLLEASLCWQCNNIHLRTGIKRRYSTFDRDAPASQRLRDLLAEIAGPAGAGEEPEDHSSER